jgi:hypothetical protein
MQNTESTVAAEMDHRSFESKGVQNTVFDSCEMMGVQNRDKMTEVASHDKMEEVCHENCCLLAQESG